MCLLVLSYLMVDIACLDALLEEPRKITALYFIEGAPHLWYADDGGNEYPGWSRLTNSFILDGSEFADEVPGKWRVVMLLTFAS